MTKQIQLICLITLIGFLLRFLDFANSPSGVYVDEAAIGYNALSLSQTGKDEFGKSWPILMRYFGAYASSLYTYLAVVPIKLLGLTIEATRITSVIMGTLLVLVTSLHFGLISGLVVALTPVLIFVSRSTYEASVALTLFITGVILIQRFARSKSFIPLGFLFLALSSYAYHPYRVISLIVGSFLALQLFRVHKGIQMRLFVGIVIYLAVQIPLYSISFSPASVDRLQDLSHTSSPLRLYLAYFMPDNLFSKPDPDIQRSFPELSVYYWWWIGFFVLGFYRFAVQKKHSAKTGRLLLLIILLTPAIGAITKDYFSTLRVLPLFFSIGLITSLGFPRQKLAIIGIVIVCCLEIYSNLVLLKYERSSIWGYEYKQIADFVKKHPSEQIVVDNTRLKPVYILLAFHNSIDPRRLQSSYDAEWLKNYYSHISFDNNHRLESVDIRPIHWKSDVYKKQFIIGDTLAISDKQATEHYLTRVQTITDIRGMPTMNIFETNPDRKLN